MIEPSSSRRPTFAETSRGPTVRGTNAKPGSIPGTVDITIWVLAIPLSVRPSTLPSPVPITSASMVASTNGNSVVRLKVDV